jgi:hypothetical protein
MKETTIEGVRYVISRERKDGTVELVSELGRVVRLPASQVPATRHVWRGVVPDSVPFAERPRAFLTELRQRRDIDLVKRRTTKKTDGDRGNVSKPKGTPRISARKDTENKLAAAMVGMPPEVAAMMQAQLAALNAPKKKGKK